MKEQIREIEQIMQKFYEKQKENEILFNINKVDEENLKKEISILKNKRLNERKKVKEKLDTIIRRKKMLYMEDMQQMLPSMVDFRDSYRILLYNEKEQILLNKISEFESKEKKVIELKQQLEKIDSKIDTLIKPYLLGIEEHDSLLKKSFMGQNYATLVNDINSKINNLTNEIAKKQELEKELNDLRKAREKYINSNKTINVRFNKEISKNTKLNFKSDLDKKINVETLETEKNNNETKYDIDFDSYVYESLNLLNNSIDSSFNMRLNELKKKSDEEKELEKQIKIVANRPNYNKVYLREMFELKYTLLPLFSDQRQQIQFSVNAELKGIDSLVSDYTQKIEERETNLKAKKQELLNIKKQLNSFELKYDNDNSIINFDIQKQLLDKYSLVLGEIRTLETQNIEYFVNSINGLLERKKELELIMNDVQQKYDILRPTSEEINAYASKMEQYEQDEYDRRKNFLNFKNTYIEKKNNVLSEENTDAILEIESPVENNDIIEEPKKQELEIEIPSELEQTNIPVIQEASNEVPIISIPSNEYLKDNEELNSCNKTQFDENEIVTIEIDELKKALSDNEIPTKQEFISQEFHPDTDVIEYIPKIKSDIENSGAKDSVKKNKKSSFHDKLNDLFETHDNESIEFMDFSDDGSFMKTKKGK